MKIGLLTSGGDCQGLNAALRGVAKTLYNQLPGVEICGIQDGYRGLIEGVWRRMDREEFSGILRQGGTILGTSRQPFKSMRDERPGKKDRLTMMLEHYRGGGFDALVVLGGNGTHKTAHLLSQNGVNVVTLPKTIDNDVYGTDLTFGFDSAVEKATAVIDAIHTTAASHGRVFVVELMGHKVGWVALYAGVAGGADVILLPEIPYSDDNILRVIEQRGHRGKTFTIIAIAEGALSREEAARTKAERKALHGSAAQRLADRLRRELDRDVRTAVPGHFQRGGEPTPADRVLCSRLGAGAARLVLEGKFGSMAALRDGRVVAVPLEEVAGKLKTVEQDCELVCQARLLGVSFGDEKADADIF